jgi:hypothetical protein
MKKPLVDVKEKQLSEYNSKVGYINKFIKNWGKTTVGGVEVLKERNYIYGMEAQAEKFLRWSGGLDSVRNQRWKGIKKAWLYINPSKDQELQEELVAANITIAATRAPDDFQFRVGIPLESSGRETIAGYTSGEKLVLAATEGFKLHGNIDRYKKELKAELQSRKAEILDKFTPRAKYPDTWVATLAKFVVLYGDYDIVTIGTGIDQDSRTSTDWDGNEYSYMVNVPILSISFTSVVNDYDEDHPVVVAAVDHKNSIEESYPEEGTEDDGYGGWFSFYQSPTPTIPSIWVQSGRYYYLRTSFLKTGIVPATGAYIKLADRIEMLSAEGFIDSDYEEKSCDWACSLTSVFIVIVAVVIALPSGGTSLTGLPLLLAIAKAVIVFAVVLTVAAAVLEGTGDVVTARGLARLNKSIAPIVQIAGLVLLVAGMMDWAEGIKNASSNLADDAAMATLESGSQFAGMSTWTGGSTVVERVASSVMDGVKNLVGNNLKLSWENGVKWVGQVAEMVQKNELGKLEKEIKSKQDKLAELQQAQEDNDGGNPAMDYQINYANMMLMDWSGYSIFERQYSGYQPKYGGGNVQRTEVGALMGMGAETYYR